MPTLHWLTREDDLETATHAPCRLLEEESDLSAGELGTGDILVQSDNLEALKT